MLRAVPGISHPQSITTGSPTITPGEQPGDLPQIRYEPGLAVAILSFVVSRRLALALFQVKSILKISSEGTEVPMAFPALISIQFTSPMVNARVRPHFSAVGQVSGLTAQH